MFAVGDKVVYPMHGAGVVKTIEKRERDGQSVDYLILAMLLGEMKVMVPVDSVERVGLRHVIENVISMPLKKFWKNVLIITIKLLHGTDALICIWKK